MKTTAQWLKFSVIASGRSLAGYQLNRFLKSSRVERLGLWFQFLNGIWTWSSGFVIELPSEPFSQIWAKHLSKKTLIPVLLSLAWQCGVILNRVTFTWNAAVLNPCPGYRPKVNSTAEDKERYVIDWCEEVVCLCVGSWGPGPVQALKAFVHYDQTGKPRGCFSFQSINGISIAPISSV